METNKLYWQTFNSPLGAITACATQQDIHLIDFADRRNLSTDLHQLAKQLNHQLIECLHPLLTQLNQQLIEYFDGQRTLFQLPIQMLGTAFQQQVWQELLKIPYGQTISYKQQADNLRNPKAIRAVARANGVNRLSIIVPCHRVIGSNGQLTGYAGGLQRKQWLLELEQRHRQ